MHNSSGLETMVSATTYGEGSGPFLLVGSDQSSACLSCHGAGPSLNGYHVSTTNISTATNSGSIPQQLTPGGDFSWLKITTSFVLRGESTTVNGESRGHSIVASDFGYTADGELTVAPGGSYQAAFLSCISCHDPHGKTRRLDNTGTYATTGLPIKNSGSYNNSANPVANVYAVGAYRILGGTNYIPKSLTGAVPAFANQVPSAVAPSTYNREETQKNAQTFVAYGQGMSEWCANCHPAFLSNNYTSGMAGLRHPAGNAAHLTAAVVANYNTYVSSGRTGAIATEAYSTLTPYEIGDGNFTNLKTFANQAVQSRLAATTNNVACVSCHRAHAGGFAEGLRFFYSNEFMTIGDSAGNASYETDTFGGGSGRSQGLTSAQIQQAYYNRPASWFGPYARMQCNKCHGKD